MLFKYLKMLGILCLAIISFFVSDRLINNQRLKSDLMQEIISKSNNYNEKVVEGNIFNNTIIPGIKGYEVDAKKSYYNMKEDNVFDEHLLVYKEVYPAVRLEDNYNKFIIGGNKYKRQIALLFKIDNNIYAEEIINILKSKGVNATFFIDGYWAESNIPVTLEIVNNYNYLGNLGYKGKYDNKTILYTNSIILKYTSDLNLYCYSEDKDLDILRVCSSKKMWTIIPNLVTNDNLYDDIRRNLSNGLMVTIDDIDNLGITIDYIRQKGYKMVTIDELLAE